MAGPGTRWRGSGGSGPRCLGGSSAPAGGRFTSTAWGIPGPGLGGRPPVRGGFKAHVWGIQTPSVNIWAGSGSLSAVQEPLGRPRAGQSRASPAHPPVLAHPHAEPPALGELVGSGLSPLVHSNGEAEDPRSLGGQGEPCRDPRRAQGRHRGGMCQDCFTLGPAPLIAPVWIFPVLLLRTQPSSQSLMSSVASLLPRDSAGAPDHPPVPDHTAGRPLPKAASCMGFTPHTQTVQGSFFFLAIFSDPQLTCSGGSCPEGYPHIPAKSPRSPSTWQLCLLPSGTWQWPLL